MSPRRIVALAWAHPPVIALATVLGLFSLNRSEVPLHAIARPLAATLALALIPLVVARLRRRDLRAAALGTTLFLLAFFTFPLVEEGPALFIAYFDPQTRPIIVYSLPIWIVGMALALFGVVRIKRGRDVATQVAAVAAAALLAQPLWRLAAPPPRIETDAPTLGEVPRPGPRAAAPRVASTTAKTPDIIYIVLDAYGRADVLRRFYGFDNTPFLDALRQRGFHVAEHSQANYLQTVLALTSALNLDYVQNLTRGERLEGVGDLGPRIDDNEVMRRLRPAGYRLVSVPTGMPLTAFPSAYVTLDVERPGAVEAGITDFEALLIERTPLRFVPRPNLTGWPLHRLALRHAFLALPDAAALPYPKLVVAHILAPHPPFVYDADGNPVQPPGQAFTLTDASGLRNKIDAKAYRDGYVGQVRYVNARTLEAVDGILRNARRPTIIVVQGDHGPRQHTDWYSREKTDADEPFRNLTAIRLPDAQPGDAAAIDTITPVNTFRFLLRTRFGEDLPPLENRSYYSTLDRSFQFVLVPDPRPLLK